MVGYRNKRRIGEHWSPSLSGIPMVGYRNTSLMPSLILSESIRHSDGGVSEPRNHRGVDHRKSIRHSDGGVSELPALGIGRRQSLSGIPMVGYRNQQIAIAEACGSLSGIPMVGYRNMNRPHLQGRISLSGIPMVGYRNHN